MNLTQVQATLARHGVTVDTVRQRTGPFRHVEAGTGQDYTLLQAARTELQQSGLAVHVQQVDNRDHPQYGKLFLLIETFES